MFKKLQHVCGCIDEHLARPLGLKLQDTQRGRSRAGRVRGAAKVVERAKNRRRVQCVRGEGWKAELPRRGAPRL